jgi:hypothetical protein
MQGHSVGCAWIFEGSSFETVVSYIFSFHFEMSGTDRVKISDENARLKLCFCFYRWDLTA